MKRNLFLLLLSLGTLFLFAQEPVLLRNSQYLGFDGCKAELSSGSSIIFWNDTSSGSSDILAQKISSEGNLLWASPRAVVARENEQRIKAVKLSSDGNVLILYWDYCILNNNVSWWVQKLSQAGQPLWPNGGAQIVSGEYYYNEPLLVENSQGGAYVIWRQNYPQLYVFGANLDSFGTNLWPSVPLYSLNGLADINGVEDGAGGIIINNSLYVSGQGYVNRLVRYDAAGDIVGANPMLSPDAAVPPEFTLIKDSQGSYVLYSRQDNLLRLQKMDASGNLLLPAVVTLTLPIDYYLNRFTIVPTPNGGVAYAYINEDGNGSFNLMLNYLDTAFQPLWTNPLNIQVQNSTNELNLKFNNGLWLSWITTNYNTYIPDSGVYALKIGVDGLPAFQPVQLSSLTGYKQRPVLTAYSDKAMAFWNDNGSMTIGIKAQCVTNSGAILLETEGRDVCGVLNGTTTLERIHNIGNSFLHIYDDSRMFWQNKIYYQITTSEGQPTLEINGRALNHDSQLSESYLDSIEGPGNNWTVLYSTYDNGSYNLWIQKINASGAQCWPGYGKAVVSQSGSSFSQSKLSMVGNDIMVVWIGFDASTVWGSINGQLYSNEVAQWPANGKILVDSQGRYLNICNLLGSYLVYHEENYNTGSVSIKALRFDNQGNPATGWPANGLDMSDEDGFYTYYQNSGVSNDNLVVAYMMLSSDSFTSRVQKVNANGEKLWGADGIIYWNDEPWSTSTLVDAVFDNGACFLIKDSATSMLHLLRIEANGELSWGETGCQITASQIIIENCALIEFANGSYSVFYNSGNEYYLSRQDVDHLGNLINAEPIIISSNINGYWNIKACSYQNMATVDWNDANYYELSSKGDGISLNSLWTLRVAASPVSNDDQIQSPGISSLSNYPNPFNPSTTISFGIKENARVSVDIYNLKGQHIRNLMDESKAPGNHSVQWDGRDDQERAVAAGVYLYKIHTGTYSSSKKMVLLK
jgi:hypothetical protein